MTEKEALLYAQLPQFKSLVKKTQGFCKWALAKVQNPYVACSFGKDSAVMLHLLLGLNHNIPVRFVRWHGETELINNFDKVIKDWQIRFAINLFQIELSRTSTNEKVEERKTFNTSEYDSYFIGLRQQESTARRITLKTHGMFYLNRGGMTRISPLSEWTDKDIAAYNCSNQLPTLETYLKNGFESRTASRVPRADFGIRANFLTELKNRDISAYNQLLNNFPELSYNA